MDTPDVPLGGKTVSGDMGQILPVMKEGSVDDVEAYALPSWHLWKLRQPLTLSTNMRASADPWFADWLTRVRDGSANHHGTDVITVPEELLVAPRTKQQTGRTRYKTSKDGNVRDEMDVVDALIDKV